MSGRIPTPEPRKVRKLPIVFVVVGTLFGLAFFLFLWNIAVNLQQENAPKSRQGTFEAQ